MTGFEIYVFVLCFIVFTLLTAMFTYLIGCITKMELQFIRFGHRDEEIKKEQEKQLNKNKNLSQVLLWFNRVFSLLLCLVLVAVFIFAIYVRTTEDRPANGIPSIKIVKSESMAKRNTKNLYLFEKGLDDQFQMFDVVICRHIPAEDELKLYDIVVYQKDDIQIIHRIVGIEEPNEKHPNERHFLLQGDANENPDAFPVLYSQMQGVYEGERVPYVGSFLLFLQSPAGWLCIVLIVFGIIITPIVERLIEKEKRKRLALLFPKESKDEAEQNGEEKVECVQPVRLITLSPQHILVFRYTNGGKMCEIGTAVLNRYFKDGETVDLSALKNRGIIATECEEFRVIAGGKLTKRLSVSENCCSKMARKIITRAGGSTVAPDCQSNSQSEVIDNV